MRSLDNGQMVRPRTIELWPNGPCPFRFVADDAHPGFFTGDEIVHRLQLFQFHYFHYELAF